MLRDPNVDNIRTPVGARFRLRFRTPHSVFINIVVPDCVLHNIIDKKYKSIIPTEFKVLVVLSMMARGHDIDTMEELSHIPRSTCH